MYVVLVPLLLILMLMVVVSLVRGIAAFLQSTKEDLNREGTGATPSQLMQNRMMKNRIMFQAMAIGVVALLLAISHASTN
ncbi:MAG: HIG1 domain-containing protein [Sphingomonadales bacterium]|nr:HIG1 domain-containing protein [Sphingomonadales bacterium]MDE2570638.1 HIG1 domain-containing protein [Sphingomonadales bacterium]